MKRETACAAGLCFCCILSSKSLLHLFFVVVCFTLQGCPEEARLSSALLASDALLPQAALSKDLVSFLPITHSQQPAAFLPYLLPRHRV